MLTYVVGNIFESPAKVLVNPVNTVGVMGKGLAKDFKDIYPEMFKQYQILCEQNKFNIGQLWLYKTNNKWILNFPTKINWRQKSEISYIEQGLIKFKATYADKGITSIAFPMLGCGNGELGWKDQVQPLMYDKLKSIPIDIYVYIGQRNSGIVEHKNIEEIKAWLRSEPKSMSFNEVWNDIVQVLAEKNDFITFDENQTHFKASIGKLNEEQYIEIDDGTTINSIYRDNILELWQHVRNLGFCISTSMPCNLDTFSMYIMSILKELKYLKPIIITTNAQNIPETCSGLQYIHPVHDVRLNGSLFKTTAHHKLLDSGYAS